MLVKAKETLPNCELVKSGGFADETTTESSHRSSHEEGFECIFIVSRDVLVLVIHFAEQLS